MPLYRNTPLPALALFFVFCCTLADAAVTPSGLYEKALTSDLTFSYQGRQFITTYNDDGRSMSYVTEVTHVAPDDFKIVYEAPARDVGRTIVEDGSQQWTFFPKSKMVIHSTQSLPLTRKQASAKYDLLRRNYYLTLDPKTTVLANRKVFRLVLSPRGNRGNVCRLWIDPDTGMVLRKEQYHADGAIDTIMYFSEISMLKNAAPLEFSASSLSIKNPKIVEMTTAQEIAIRRSDAAGYFGRNAAVPESVDGFQLQSLTVMHEHQGATLHLEYSDGLTSLSLFESQRSSKQATLIAHSRLVYLHRLGFGHSVQRYSYNTLNWDTAHLNLTLVGDVRSQTLASLAESLSMPS
jgi:outer membrane lipoprotein-sorting protein